MKQIDETKLVMSRTFNVDQQRLFEAWSNPAIMEKWFFPFGEGGYAEVEHNFTVGGEYTIDMYEPSGEKWQQTGEYREIRPYDKIVFSWIATEEKETVVTLEFNPVEEGTELTLTHEFLPTAQSTQRHAEGWEGCFASLERQLVVKA